MKKQIDVPKSHESSKFYDDLMEGKEQRGILGKDARFNALRIVQRSSTKKYFTDVIAPYLSKQDKVLDFGCGPGSFLAAAAPLCGEIIGVDISKNFVTATDDIIKKLNLENAKSLHVEPDKLPFEDDCFESIILVDIVHHLEDITTTMQEVMRVLKSGGKLLIFEPNKLNPLIYLVHLRDKNEWGLLKLGTPWVYKKILGPILDVESVDFNGIVIGPESKIFNFISDMLNFQFLKPFIGWLNPKMFIIGVKRQ